jgi:putative PIN family toxin of toxin-antitoxin system
VASRKVVFDTNILISGYLWKGSPRRAIDKVRRGEWIHPVSEETIEELIRVLAYAKFGLKPEEIEPIIRDLMAISKYVEVRSKIDLVKADPTDNIFLNLAIDGQADVIVPGDHHLLDLKEFNEIPIISVRRFLGL